jgi:hypothetical protein
VHPYELVGVFTGRHRGDRRDADHGEPISGVMLA